MGDRLRLTLLIFFLFFVAFLGSLGIFLHIFGIFCYVFSSSSLYLHAIGAALASIGARFASSMNYYTLFLYICFFCIFFYSGRHLEECRRSMSGPGVNTAGIGMPFSYRI